MRAGQPLARRRGVAVILVVVVIAALLAIAAPFVFSMRLHDRSARGFASQVEAQQLADAGRNAAITQLALGHPDEERRAREALGDLRSDDEGRDTLTEVTDAQTLGQGSGLRPFKTDDTRGAMITVEVADTRGRIDLNASPPDPVANLLGVTLTTAEFEYDEVDVLWVEDTSDFYSDNDPRTVDGLLKVSTSPRRFEYIAYRHKRADRFEGLERGYFFSRRPPPEEKEDRDPVQPGALVQDGRGDKITLDAVWRYLGTSRQGELARYDSTAAIRRIADWEFGTARAAMVLLAYGVTMGQLGDWRVSESAVFGAGLDPYDFDADAPPPDDETREERQEREEAQEALEDWGVPLSVVRRFGGARAMVRVYRNLMRLSASQREKQIAVYKQRAQQLEANLQRLDRWFQDEVGAQLRSLTEMRDEAPFLETIGRIELEEKIRPFVTVDAPPEGARWSDPEVVNHTLRLNPLDWVSRVSVPDARRFVAGTVVRVQPRDGRPAEYRYCVRVRARGSGRSQVLLFPQLDGDYDPREVEVSARMPSPVNVNTASREVLEAILIGLQGRVGQRSSGSRSPLVVTPTQATAIADRIVDSPPSSFLELRGLLRDLRSEDAIDDHAVSAVLRNAIDPGDPMLVRSTVPFCFNTGDVYELSSTGIVNDPAGNEIARHRVREVVQVAPPRELTWHLDSQADFTDRVYTSGPLARGEFSLAQKHEMYLPGRWAHHIQTRPAYLGPFGGSAWLFPDRSHAPGSGDLQPLPGREPDAGQGSNAPPTLQGAGVTGGPQEGRLRQDHWETELDGVDLAGLSQAAAQMPKRYYLRESLTLVEALGPGLIRGWFRFDQPTGARSYLFDGGEEDAINRLSLYMEGGELVLAAKDEALDLQETGGNPRAAEVRYRPDPPFRAGNWYHVAAFFKGSDRGDLALMVDGRMVGVQTHGSVLSQPIDLSTGAIPVEDASGFPPSGWIRVGASRGHGQTGGRPQEDRGIWGSGEDANNRCEVLFYDSKSGNSLNVATPVEPTLEYLRANGIPATITDLDNANAGVSTIRARGRRPQRGSGHRLRLDWVDPTTNQPQSATTTLGYAHEAGTVVVPYGYTARVADAAGGFVDRVRLGGAQLAGPLPAWTPYTLLYDPVPGYNPRTTPGFPHPVIVDANRVQLPVLWVAPYGDPPTGPLRNDPQATSPQPNLIGGFPTRGVLRVGDELIYYDGIDPQGRFFNNCVRGFLGTTATDHTLFEPVALASIRVSYPANYSQAPDDHYAQRADRATVGRVYVSLPQGTGAPEWLSVQPALPGMDPRVDLIARGVMLAPVSEAGALGRHGLEYGLIREMLSRSGDLGATPGLDPFTDTNPQQPDPENGVLWKEILKRAEAQGQFSSAARQQKGTSRPAVPAASPQHAAGTPLYPTFVVRSRDADEAGAGDVVTLTDDQTLVPQREELTLAHRASARTSQGDQANGDLLAFTGDAGRIYEGAVHARLARWPTGNVNHVPDLTFGRAMPSTQTPAAPLQARVDDLVVMQLDEVPRGVRFNTPVQAYVHGGPGQVQVTSATGQVQQYQDGHLTLMDGEAIAVVAAAGQPNDLTLDLLRGALGSTPRSQSPETIPWRVPWPPVAVAQGGFGGNRGQAIGVQGGQTFRTQAEGGGYAALDPGLGNPWAAVYPYTDRGNGFLQRAKDNLDRGAFPVAFGSNVTVPGANDLLVDLPFRAHDRYADRISSREGVYFQAARELPGGFVTSIDWDETLPSPYCEVKVAVRVDGMPGWDAQPATAPSQPGQLYVFDDPSQANEIFLPGDRVELRVYVTFKPAAIYADAWKQPALVGAVRVRYRQPTSSRRREERID